MPDLSQYCSDPNTCIIGGVVVGVLLALDVAFFTAMVLLAWRGLR